MNSYIKRLEEQLDTLSDNLKTIEWRGTVFLKGKEYSVCPVCGFSKKFGGNENGHSDNCWLANHIYN